MKKQKVQEAAKSEMISDMFFMLPLKAIREKFSQSHWVCFRSPTGQSPAEPLIGKLEEKCTSLPSNYKQALSADPDEIMYTTPGDVGIFYDDNGRKFVSILMRFWYLTNARLPDDSMEGTRIFKVDLEDGEGETKRLLTAIYEWVPETAGIFL
ncbi:hypothetical protein CRENBAI_012834 [Crenichthys baileyi]|uniref:SMI1/KNR4 family protein n=1 Tax=Crenichthys baileyi TaxID=28760 RepID=A0AAV9RJY7_9TELE